jgi:serine/threonine-protein kinase
LNKAKPNLSFPLAVEEVVMRALSKQPAERYASVQAFSDAFVAAASGAPPQGIPAVARPSGSAPATPTPSPSAEAVSEDKGGGLFGKMKGLFGKR